jgi:hypothetical protein
MAIASMATVVSTDIGGGAAIDGPARLQQWHPGGGPGVRSEHPGDHTVGQEALEDLGYQGRQTIAVRADQRDLHARTQMEIERAEEATEAARVPRHQIGQRA